jgi:FAD/FMN-containing dehydrogenase
MILEATTSTDVRKAVLTARRRDLPFAVYATGHGGPLPDRDDVVVVTTAGLGSTVLVDPDRRTARVGPGTVWGDVVAAAAPFGLVPLAGSHESVGVIGYTLGGGMSWLSRRYGFAADSVLRAEVVTADGEVRTISADREPDLFWAIRGGGANFAAVLSLEFRLYPLREVYAGEATFPVDRAAEVLTCYRDGVADRPDELNVNVLLTKHAMTIRGVYAGGADDARRALAPLFRAAGEPLRYDWRALPFTEGHTVGTAGPDHFHHLATLPDTAIEAALAAVQGDAEAVEVRYWGGAIAASANPGPAGRRDEPYVVVVEGEPEAAAAVAAHATGGTFLNSLHDPARADTAFTEENYARLQELKHHWDPSNLFGMAKNIPPASPAFTHTESRFRA